MHAPATAGRDPPQFLDVDVDQVARLFVLVATDHAPRGPIHPAQPIQLPAHQHAMHRRGRHLQADGDADWAELGAASQRLDLSLHRAEVRRGLRSGRELRSSRPASPSSDVPMPPLVRRRPRDAHLARNVRRGRPWAIRRTRISLPIGVSTALGWDTGEPPSGWISTTQTQPGGSLFVNNLYGHYT